MLKFSFQKTNIFAYICEDIGGYTLYTPLLYTIQALADMSAKNVSYGFPDKDIILVVLI